MSYGSDHDPYDMVGVSPVYMVHHPNHNSIQCCSVSHSVIPVGVVYATTETCHHDLWNHDLRHEIHVSVLLTPLVTLSSTTTTMLVLVQ